MKLDQDPKLEQAQQLVEISRRVRQEILDVRKETEELLLRTQFAETDLTEIKGQLQHLIKTQHKLANRYYQLEQQVLIFIGDEDALAAQREYMLQREADVEREAAVERRSQEPTRPVRPAPPRKPKPTGAR